MQVYNVSRHRRITNRAGLKFDGCQMRLLEFKSKLICGIYLQRLLVSKSQCYVNSAPVHTSMCLALREISHSVLCIV